MFVFQFSEKDNTKNSKNGITGGPDQPANPIEKSVESGTLPNQPEEYEVPKKQSRPEADESKGEILQAETKNDKNDTVLINVRSKWLASDLCTLTN